MAGGDEGNGRVTLALVQQTAQANREDIKETRADVREIKELLQGELSALKNEIARHDERIKNLSTRSNALDVVAAIAGAIAGAVTAVFTNKGP